MANQIRIRLPARVPPGVPSPTSCSDASSTIPLLGNWYILCTSVRFWRDKKNIQVTYTLPADSAQLPDAGDDNVDFSKDFVLNSVSSYQAASGEDCESIETTAGTDRPIPNSLPGTMTWQGTGFYKFISSRHEIIGYGRVPNESNASSTESDDPALWMVGYSSKSMFSRSALSIYTKGTKALSTQFVESIKQALADLDHKDLQECLDGMFDVHQD